MGWFGDGNLKQWWDVVGVLGEEWEAVRVVKWWRMVFECEEAQSVSWG